MTSSSQKFDVGLIGLAVMGSNLALNIASNGFTVCVFDIDTTRTTKFIQSLKTNLQLQDPIIQPTFSYSELCAKVSRKPIRKFIVLVKSSAVDEVISELVKVISFGDVVIDFGNSNFLDTERRFKRLEHEGYHFMGCGISGGENGAKFGASLMVGGSKKVWNEHLKQLFMAISAKTTTIEKGNYLCCVDWMGTGGSGHYVKMIHNGIEYAEMQLICEIYSVLKMAGRLTNDFIAELFSNWSKENGKLRSYLLEITSIILKRKNEKGEPIIDLILDCAAQKGTGKWMVETALFDESAAPTVISHSVFARFLSSLKNERITASKILSSKFPSIPPLQKQDEINALINDSQNALLFGRIIANSQAFHQLACASLKYFGWSEMNLKSIATIWKSGCIIRSGLLDYIISSLGDNSNLINSKQFIFTSEPLSTIVSQSILGCRRFISHAILNGIPLPCLSNSISFFDSYNNNITNF